MEWVLDERQGIDTKIGKFNTQLELGCSIFSVKQMIIKMVAQLVIYREHQCQHQWQNITKKKDLIMSNLDLYFVIYTDFGATLDLMACEKDSSIMNNHTVICIFFVCTI